MKRIEENSWLDNHKGYDIIIDEERCVIIVKQPNGNLVRYNYDHVPYISDFEKVKEHIDNIENYGGKA